MTFSKTQVAGDLNVVVVGWNDATSEVESVTDSSGNSYVAAVGPTVQSGTATQVIYYAKNIGAAAAGSNAVTVNFNTAASYPDIRVAEYSGISQTSAVDVVAAAQGSSSTSSSGSVTTTNANDLLVGANLVQHTTTGAGPGFTSRVITSPDSDILEDSTVASTGSYSATAPTTGGAWIMQMVAFRSAATGSAIKLVQHGSVDKGGSATSSAVVTLSGVTNGDLLTCSLTYGNNGGTTLSVSDSLNGSWSVANAAHYNSNIVQTTGQFYFANSKAGTITIAGTPSGAGTWGAMNCQEWSGAATSSPLDQGTSADGTTANPSSGSVTSTAAGDLVLGDLENGIGPGAGSGFSLISSTPNTGLSTEYLIQSSAGSTAATWTLAATGWTAQLATFKAAVGGGGGTPPSISVLSPTSGPVGTTVTITGTNFGSTQGTSSVTFNGTLGVPASWSATSIVVPVPSGATTGNVEVVVGGVASNGMSFTVGSVLAPSFTLIQHPQTTNTTCSTTVNTCTLSVASTGSGHFGVVTVGLLAAANSWVTSITDNQGGTWIVPGNTGSGGCYLYAGVYGTTGCAYNLTLPAGVTSITGTWSSVVPEGARMDFREYSYTGGSVQLDNIGTYSDPSTPVTTITGISPVLSGTDDVIVQAFSSGSSHATGVTTYGDANIGDSLYGSADLLNTTSTVAPTFTTCCANTVYGAIYIAFRLTNGVPQAATPVCTPGTGTYNNSQSVSCSNPSSAPVLCYTTNGSTPVTNGAKGCTTGTVVSGSISITSTATNLQVVAGGTGFTNSSPASDTYTLTVGTPTFSPPAGSYSSSESIMVSTATSGASLEYCLDTTNTCTPGTAYSGPVTVASSEYLRAEGTLSGFTSSNIGSAQYIEGATGVTLTPIRAGATVTQQIPLTASVAGTAGVSWNVSAGGTLSAETTTTAIFSATSAGIYTVTATSMANVTQSATATISVTNLAGVYTYHNDLARDGSNTQEYALTPSNVNTSTFGKLFSCTVDGAIYTQPLWVANLSFSGVQHNVVFVATQHDSLYAFDADANPCVLLWQVSLIDSAHGANPNETSVPSSGSGHLVGGGTGDITPEVGVTGTPVIDPTSNTLFVVSKSVIASEPTPTFYQRLHAINVFTGNEETGSPLGLTNLNITYPGTGDGSTTDVFNARTENQRPALALVNGVIYVAWASHEDYGSYYGWIIGVTYNATSSPNFSIPYILNIDPNAHDGGIWMGGAAPSADSSNNLYLISGNGLFDVTNSTAPNNDYGDSALQLTSSLTITQYFTPSDQLIDQEDDHDFGSGGATVLADLPVNLQEPSNPTHLLIGGGKDGTLYLLNRDKMGGSGDANAWQHFPSGHSIFCIGAFWNGTFYIAPINSALEAYALNSGTAMMSTSPSSVSSTTFGFPGASPSVSSNGTADGIVWALNNGNYCTAQSSGCGPTVLHAYSAVPTALGTDLWNSSMVSTDAGGNAVKFTVPTVANGKVYVGTRGNNIGGVYNSTTVSGELDVFGLKPK